jgi:UDP-N-acetylglucosamine 1-carboxyvinyltransferase
VEVKASGEPPASTSFDIPPDRNDAATWVLAAGMGMGRVVVRGFNPVEVRLALDFLRDLGARIAEGASHVTVDCTGGLEANGYELILGPSPEFHSDWGPFAEGVLARAGGVSHVEDRMYEGRYRHVDELNRLGADIRYIQRTVPRGALMFDRAAESVTALEIRGGRRLQGAAVVGRDVRGAAVLAIAGASARGTTRLAGLDQLGRGYENFRERFAGLGVSAELV